MDAEKLRQSFTKCDIRTVTKCLLLLDKKPLEIHNDFVCAIGDQAPKITTVRWWVKQFQKRRINIEDEQTSVRPLTACGDASIALVRSAVDEDKRKIS